MSKTIKLAQKEALILPPSLTGQVGISHLLIEIESVDNDLGTQKIRSPGATLVVPAISRQLKEILELNKQSIVSSKDRATLIRQLKTTKEKAPVIHITFASEPEPSILVQLISWIRTNLHPSALVTIGVQPAIVGGCVFRTPDHIYDFSFRNQLVASKSLLTDRLKEL